MSGGTNTPPGAMPLRAHGGRAGYDDGGYVFGDPSIPAMPLPDHAPDKPMPTVGDENFSRAKMLAPPGMGDAGSLALPKLEEHETPQQPGGGQEVDWGSGRPVSYTMQSSPTQVPPPPAQAKAAEAPPPDGHAVPSVEPDARDAKAINMARLVAGPPGRPEEKAAPVAKKKLVDDPRINEMPPPPPPKPPVPEQAAQQQTPAPQAQPAQQQQQPPAAEEMRKSAYGARSPWEVVAAIGAGIASSRSPHFGVALGEGVQQGLAAQARGREGELKEYSAEKQAKQFADHLALTRKQLDLQSEYHKDLIQERQDVAHERAQNYAQNSEWMHEDRNARIAAQQAAAADAAANRKLQTDIHKQTPLYYTTKEDGKEYPVYPGGVIGDVPMSAPRSGVDKTEATQYQRAELAAKIKAGDVTGTMSNDDALKQADELLGRGSATPPPAPAIDALKQDPSPQRRQQFDQVFGQGAAARVLGQ